MKNDDVENKSYQLTMSQTYNSLNVKQLRTVRLYVEKWAAKKTKRMRNILWSTKTSKQSLKFDDFEGFEASTMINSIIKLKTTNSLRVP